MEEIQGLDPGLLKLGKVHGQDPGLFMTVNTNSGHIIPWPAEIVLFWLESLFC
jgi:hypothetical protein